MGGKHRRRVRRESVRRVELRAAPPPTDPAELARAVARASAGLEASRWRVLGSILSPVTGARGAIEILVHARRA